MSYASEALRRHWLPNIQTVVGRPQKGFGPYLLDQNYQVYNRPTAQRVELFFSDASPVLSAFAFDITRFASAAVESVVDTRQNPVFNKSTAWLLIRSYYAAFFAAHAISRMLGISFTRFETTHCNSVLKVARLFHEDIPPIPRLGNGLYRCQVDADSQKIDCELLSDGAGGSHEGFWTSFSSLMREKSAAVLISKAGLPENNALASDSLDALREVLNLRGGRPGAWLSFMRNSINYQHAHGCWYPYRDPADESDAIFDRSNRWLEDADRVVLTTGRDEMHRYQAASNYLVSLCREMSVDMAARTPRGKSFHQVGVLAMLERVQQL